MKQCYILHFLRLKQEKFTYSIGIIAEESESLSVYGPGENWRTFYHPDYVPTFAPTFNNVTLEREAKKMCGDDQFCLFDIAATKRVEIGAATMEGLETLDVIIEMSKPSESMSREMLEDIYMNTKL